MDALADFFKAVRLEGSIFFNTKLQTAWSLEVESSPYPKFHLVVSGETCVQAPAFAETLCLKQGDVLFLNDGSAHKICNSKGINPLAPSSCHLVCGTLGFDQQHGHPLTELLPPYIRTSMPRDHRSFWALVRIMINELNNEAPGYAISVDKLCELLMIHLLRSLSDSNLVVPAFALALEDPYTRKALKLIHGKPECSWTVGTLADAAGISRSAFAKRFNRLVGMPPRAYLTRWRMYKAKLMLSNSRALVASVAHSVGYASDAAFNRAFTRFFGANPGKYQE